MKGEEFIMRKLELYTIDVQYVEALYQQDREVFYDVSSDNYEGKPYVGVLLQAHRYYYFIPLTSAKKKHINWKNVSKDNYLIYEMLPKTNVSSDQVCKMIENTGVAKHILAVLEIKKMIPVQASLYQKIDFDKIEDEKYRALLMKEYEFLKPLAGDIFQKAEKIYQEQKETGVIHPYYCNFSKLETVCDTYGQAGGGI